MSQLISTLDDFSNSLKNQKQTDAILLDFSKAFDKVDHLGLLSKLENLGIRGPLLDWTSSFLIGRKQCVVVDGRASPHSDVLSGVPQGTVLGPLFFLVYINDISKGLSQGTSIRLFADDSLLYRQINSQKDCEILQKDLDTLQIWESKFKMDISRHLHMHGCIKRQVYFKILSHKVEIKGCGFGGLRSTGVEIVQVDNLMSRWHDKDIITHSRFSDKGLKNCRYRDMFI